MSMDWANERYVRLFIRDTVTWRRWSWEARATFCLLLRKVDRSGVLDTGRDDKAEALALIIDVPIDVATKALSEWVAAGTVEAKETALVIPRFLEAQEAAQSDAMRQRESRERRKAVTLQSSEDARHTLSHAVTGRHTASQPVTPARPDQPSRPDQTSQTDPDQPLRSAARKSKKRDQQAELGVTPPPPTPPKAPSRVALLVQSLAEARQGRLISLDLDPGQYPDEEPDYGRSAGFVSAVERRYTGRTPEQIDLLISAIHATWLESEFWSRTRDREGKPAVPYPWGAFITEGQWRKIADEEFPAEVAA